MSLVYNPLLLNGFQDTSAGGGGGGTTPAGSTGAIQFNDTGAFGADTANLFWDNTNKSLLLGTNSQPAGTTNVPFYVLQTNSNAGNSFLYTERVFADANANGFAFRKARGTTVTRANVLAGDGLGGITFNGYTAAGYGAGTVLVGGTAQEDFSNTTTANRGSNFLVQTTPTGASGSRRNSMSVGAGFMRLYETAGVNNIQMNSAPSASYTMSLPPALPAGSAFWTIGSGGSGNFSALSGDAASTGAQGAVTVTGLRGTPVSATAPTNAQFLAYSVGPLAWQPTTFSGDITPTGAVGNLTVSKIQTVAVSNTAPTNGQVLTYDSGTTQWKPATPSGGSGTTPTVTIKKVAGSSSYTPPVGCKLLKITLVGGGGGGGAVPAASGSPDGASAAGGGGGGGVIKYISNPVGPYNVVVGAGGLGRTTFAAPFKGDDGTASVWDSIYTAGGGVGGSSCGHGGSTFIFGDPGGTGGNGSGGGDIESGGDGGLNGIYPGNGNYYSGGNGGSSSFGMGGGGVGSGEHAASTNGSNGTGYGGGGGGAGMASGTANSGAGSGGNGTDGIVIIDEFY